MRSVSTVMQAALSAMVLCAAPALAGLATADVDVRLVPALTPAGVDTLQPGDPLYDAGYLGVRGQWSVLRIDWAVDPNYVLEVWVSDVGDVNTGVISAYFDVFWDNVAINSAGDVHHSPLFSLFEGDSINNFGGSDETFLGQGVEPIFARVGWIDFELTGPGIVRLGAVVGPSEVGVLNRTVGDVQITGAAVPEPTSLLLLGLGGLAVVKRRNRVVSVRTKRHVVS